MATTETTDASTQTDNTNETLKPTLIETFDETDVTKNETDEADETSGEEHTSDESDGENNSDSGSGSSEEDGESNSDSGSGSSDEDETPKTFLDKLSDRMLDVINWYNPIDYDNDDYVEDYDAELTVYKQQMFVFGIFTGYFSLLTYLYLTN